MEARTLGFLFTLLYLNRFIEATDINGNETLQEDLRQPRVSGRIVKLYSGIRPEPIHCPDDGFQPDPSDCAVFYRCVKASNGKYTIFRFQCGPGTVYDPDTEVCNHPQSTKRSECGGRVVSSTEHIKENEIDRIQSELPSPISTKKPVYTLQTTTQKAISTQYPWATSTKRQSSEVTTTTLTSAYPWASSTKRSEALTSSKSTAYPWVTSQQSATTSRVIDSAPHHSSGDVCSSDGFMGDSENCRKFYRCVGNQRGGFIRYEFSCSESTIWDDDSQSCNHPWAVQRRRCGRGGTQTDKPSNPSNQTQNKLPSDATTTIQQQTQINYGEKVSQTQSQISHGPVIQNQTQINYGDRLNKGTSTAKQNQTQISHGSALSQTQTQINHGNKGVQTQLQIDHSNKSSQTQTQVYESSSKSTTTTGIQDDESDQGYGSTQANNENSSNNEDGTNKCTESGFMGDKNNCKKFYRCVDNGKGSYTKYEFSCGEGTVWDPNLEACNHAWAVKECGGKVPTETSTAAQDVTKSTTMPTSTQNYYPTSESTTTEDDDLPSYGNQNQDRPTTTKPTTIQEKPASTESSNTGETVCTSSGFIGDENDCKKFYRCVDNGRGSYTKYEYKCGEGTVWDPDIEACNHVWAVKKCGGSSTDVNKVETTTKAESTVMTTVSLVQTTTQTSNQNIDDYDSGYNNQNQQSESPSIATTTKQPQNNPSSGSHCQSSGFMGDKDDCKKFYRCVDAGNGGYIRYEFSCGEGTVWDPKIDACNHAWAVEKCGEDDSADVHKETTSRPSPTMHDEDGSVSYTTEDQGYDQGYQSTEKTTTTTSTSQSTPQSTDDLCTQEGFSGDRNDCRKFYRCINNQRGGFIKYEFSCGEGTVWDSEINACNHERDVKTPCSAGTATQSENPTESSQESITDQTTQISSSETTASQSSATSSSTKQPPSGKQCIQEGFVGDDQDCKKFYRCVDNSKGGFIKYEFSCGDGTVWDPEIQACNHPSPDRHCGGSGEGTVSTTREPDRENDEMYTTTSASTTSTGQSSTTSSTQKPQTSSDTCKSEGFFGASNDCKKFYRCVDNGKGSYTKYDFTCGDGTIWVQDIQACDHDGENTDCSRNSDNGDTQTSEIQTETTEGYSSTTSTSTDVEQQQSLQTTQAPSSSSSSKCTSEGFYANPDDCRKFYRCVNNGNGGYTKYDFSCGDGTVWVQDIQACDHDNGIESCTKQGGSSTTAAQWTGEPQTSSESSTATTGATSSQPEPDKSNDEYPSETSTKPSPGEDKCSSEGFYPNEKDCKRFYRCVDNGNGGFTKYDFACGEGTAWDSNIQSCNHINEVENCQGSHQESQSQPVMQDEDAQPTGENTSTSTTEQTSTSGPDSGNSKPSNKDTCEQEGYFGNSEDCKKFYRCVDNGKGGLTKYDYTCGEGTIWDQDVTTCNHPHDVVNPSCKQQSDNSPSSSSESSETTSSSSSSTTQSSSTTESSGQDGSSGCSQEDSSKKPANKDVNCTEAGYFADPNDCKKFYRCVDWDGDGKRFSVYHFDCGEGTIWDPALDTCNYEDSVYPPRDCSGAQSQNENVNQESSTTEKSTTEEGSTTTQQSTTTDQTTTQESSNDKETTTEQSSTTSEQTTTQESTTSEQTTTQKQTTQQTTNEQTTMQQTTSEQTTTEKTTTEQTTTQQTTSSEQTTQQQTTSEQTTEQQTTEQQTTEQQTTSEQTTEQQTTSEQTTTQQSTTEETTSQQTTNEQTTTQESTTSEQTTTQQTTEQTTSQESTTTEQTTTEQTTTSDNNDQQSTTEQSTDETTTQESTTEQQTTTEQSNETTEDSTSTTSQTDDSSTTEGGDETTTESGQETTESSSSNGDCPETEDDQNLFVCPTSFRRHPKYCNLFYQCTEDDDSHDVKIAMFNCPNNTIYDETQTKCVEEDKADKKCDGEIAQRRRVKRLDAAYKEPIEVTKERLKCPAVGHFPFETEECSSAFLKCQRAKSGKIRGFVYQCPEGYVYWSVSRRCELKSNVRDCKRSYNNWNGRWEIPIERRNVAP